MKSDQPILFILDFLLGVLIVGLGVWSSYLLINNWQGQSVDSWIRPIILTALVFILGFAQLNVAVRRNHRKKK